MPTWLSAAFSSVAEFQIYNYDGMQLNPPILSPTIMHHDLNVNEPNDEIDEEFLNALGIIHHNPNVLFDANMTEIPSSSALGLNEHTVDSLK